MIKAERKRFNKKGKVIMKKEIMMVSLICLLLSGCGENNTDKNIAANNEEGPKAIASGGQNNVNSGTQYNITNNQIVTKEDKANTIRIDDLTNQVSVTNDKGVIELKFKNTNSDEYLKSINGKKVSVTGYISSLSPISGKFAYLMNLPYQNCPFCVPGTSSIYNTLAIYSSGNDKIEFTDKPVTVEGTLEVGDFTDEFGYQYKVRINKAKVKDADIDKLSKNVLIYSAVSKEGIVTEINNIMMELDKIIFYDFYQQQNNVSPDSIKPFDLGRIDTVIGKLKAISENDYSDLIQTLQSARGIVNTANDNINNKQIEKNKDLQQSINEVFRSFFMWLGKYEL
jgi:hypothetical protein